MPLMNQHLAFDREVTLLEQLTRVLKLAQKNTLESRTEGTSLELLLPENFWPNDGSLELPRTRLHATEAKIRLAPGWSYEMTASVSLSS